MAFQAHQSLLGVCFILLSRLNRMKIHCGVSNFRGVAESSRAMPSRSAVVLRSNLSICSYVKISELEVITKALPSPVKVVLVDTRCFLQPMASPLTSTLRVMVVTPKGETLVANEYQRSNLF